MNMDDVEVEDKIVVLDDKRRAKELIGKHSLGEAVMIEDPGTFVVLVIIVAIAIIKWRILLAIIAAIIVALVLTGLVQVLSAVSGHGA